MENSMSELEIKKAAKYPLNLLTDAQIKNIGAMVYGQK